MDYKIIHTSKKESIDGKEHYKIYTNQKAKGVLESYSKTVLIPLTNVDHETYEESLKEMETIKNDRIRKKR